MATERRFRVVDTPKGLWPFAVYDAERRTWVARFNRREDADREASERNCRASA